MAAAVRAVTTLALGSRTTSTWTPPSGLADNDILLCVFVTGRNPAIPTITAPSGFASATGLPFTINKGAGYQLATQVYWKKAAGESGSYDFVGSAAADTEGVMYAISGANGTTPLNPNPSTNTGNSFTTTALGITTAVNDSVVIFVNTAWDDQGGAGVPTGTTPTFGSRYAPGLTGVLNLCDGVLATAGATGDKTAANGNNSSGNPFAGILIGVAAAGATSVATTSPAALPGVRGVPMAGGRFLARASWGSAGGAGIGDGNRRRRVIC